MAELVKSSRTKWQKARAKCRTVDMKGVAAQARTERAECTARKAQVKGGAHGLKDKSEVLEGFNNVADFLFSLLVDECNYLKRPVASNGFYSGEMVPWLANVSKDFNASTRDMNCHAAQSQKSMQDIFCAKLFNLSKHLQMLFEQEVLALCMYVKEAPRKVV